MQVINWNTLSPNQQAEALLRPAVGAGDEIATIVSGVITQVQSGGDDGLRKLTSQFDGVDVTDLRVSTLDIEQASQNLNDAIKTALKNAYDNIHTFHSAQQLSPVRVETQTGVVCEQIQRPIGSVGLYIPGGSAPLPSTVLMLGVPAQIAGCGKIVLCSPPPLADEILYAAHLCGIDEIYTIGGAQAVAAMAYGTESVPKVDKIFGPGNAYVTEAKRQVSNDFLGSAIDMPAGPSEVLVIADSNADADFVAADLLSQAEHGPDSQVVVVTPCFKMADAVKQAVQTQLQSLSRSQIAGQALDNSLIIVADSLEDCVAISNAYAPEHLIVQTDNARDLLDSLDNAGSIFLGAYSPESVGDYASGTNHVLPTYGYTRTHSSLGLADFSKRMTVQELTIDGLKSIAPTVARMAEAEGLDAHKRAVTIRTDKLQYTDY